MVGLLSLMVAGAIGYVAVALWWPPVRAQPMLRVWLGLGVGFALTSCGQFLWLLTVGRASPGIMAADVALLAGLIYWIRRSPMAPTPTGARIERTASVEDRVLRILWLLTLACAGLRLLYLCVLSPQGGWDAFAIWNVRARFLHGAGAAWRVAFDPSIVHADYPLLLPGLVARGWAYGGAEPTPVVPIAVACGFAAGIIGLLHAALTTPRSTRHAHLATLAVLLPPIFVSHAATQTADVPLAFYVLATLVVLCLHDRAETDQPRLLLLAGFLAACAAWTKNEGLLFLVVLAGVRAAVLLRTHAPVGVSRQLGWCGLGALPVLAVVVVFKLQLAPPNDLVTLDTVGRMAHNLTTPARCAALGRGVGQYLLSYDTSVATALPLLLLYRLVVGKGARVHQGRPGLGTAAGTVGVMVLGYLGVYLAFSQNVLIHVQTSVDRLMLHVWPACVLVCFLVLNRNETGLMSAHATGPPEASQA